MNKENILFVIEGESREMDIVKNICNVFFKNTQIKIIPIPAGENIYMLWKKLKEDEFETASLRTAAPPQTTPLLTTALPSWPAHTRSLCGPARPPWS